MHLVISELLSVRMHQLSVAILLMCIYFYVEYKLIVVNLNALQERALYFYWIRKKINILQVFTIVVFSLMGIIQMYFYLNNYDINYVINHYGLVHKKIDNGEYWRFLAGPFFHGSFQHWVINFFLLYFSCFVHSRIASIKTLTLLLLTFILSGIAVHLISYELKVNPSFGAFCGLSAGIFFMLGLQLVVSYKLKEEFPKYYFVSVFMYALLNFLLPYITDTKASNIAHFTGLIVGVFYGCLIKRSIFEADSRI